ncbi:luciferase family protein [Actinocorallia sp. B10E7]|uniref:luciferase domain-containing protein n=1 Tax=Actinocorallia sp. B10E7 TaxID=3153558 RepID=UPI00325CE992
MSRGRLPTPVPFTEPAIDRFRDWPLVLCRADAPPGQALSLSGRQIVHFHHDDRAEVRLAHPLIHRLTPALLDSGRVDIPPHSSWIRVRLDSDSDLSLLESLVSLAIKANDPARLQPPALCPHASLIRRRAAPLVGRP